MSILDFFFARKEATAGIAKERLQIVLAHERAGRDAPDFLPALQRELLAVVGKYVAVKEDFIRVNLARQSAASVLEINIEFDPALTVPKPIEKPTRIAPAAPSRGKSAGRRR
jgi:cell division topological specificity factor